MSLHSTNSCDALSIFRLPYRHWTPEELLTYYQRRASICYFPVLDAEHTTQSKIDGVLFNRFEFNAESYSLSAHFDWTLNPSRDIEWLILLHKFYYAVGLGAAYSQTKDRRYVEKWMELTSAWIDTVPFGFLSSDVAGRRIQNWIFAHYYFVTLDRTLKLPAKFYLKFLTSISQQVNYLCAHLTPARNHRTLELYAIFLAAVVFPELQDTESWLAFSTEELLKNIQTDLLPDGVHCELSTDYHHLVLKNYLGVRRLALLNDIALPEEMDDLIRKALDFAMYVHKPDGLIPSLSDGDSRSFLDLLGQGCDLYEDDEMLYVASQGKRGTPPTCRSKAFPDSGYYIVRSGWGTATQRFEDEQYLIFDCGPLGRGNHGHFDVLSFELAAYGQSLIVDPGRYTYEESGETNWRVLFRGTGYHNTVQVDKKNQTQYAFHTTKFKVCGPEPDWELKTFISEAGFDYLHGIARSHEYEVVHERKIFFVCPEYWITSDILRAPEVHDYDLLFHLSDQAVTKVSSSVEQHTRLVDAPYLVMAQAYDPAVQCVVEDGYVSRTYGVKHQAPIVRFARHAATATYHTILYPYQSERPRISVQQLPVLHSGQTCLPSHASAMCICITHNGRSSRDYYFVAHQDSREEYTFGRFTCTGTFLFLREDTQGNIVCLQAEPKTVLKEPAHLRSER